MSRAPQDVYARYLTSSRGYPLWIPEPSQQILLSRPDGLRIGDVGVVVPEDGGFEVFFNICLPRDHPFHRAAGVPDNFKLVDLRDEDIRIISRVENPGRIISTSSVTKIRTFEPSSATPGTQLGRRSYEFDLSSSGGALLILPEGADRYDLRNRRLFFEEATSHGVDWYRFAEERLGRMISHDSLYLITGFYKAHSWSLAAFENAAGSGESSAQFKIAQVGGSNITGSYTWETTRALDWRVGPAENYGFPNQSVFIRGFKVALRTDFLGHQRVEVKADAPSTLNAKHGKFSDGVQRNSWISKVWKGLSRNSRSGTSMQDEVVHRPSTDEASGYDLNRGLLGDAVQHVVVQPMPEFSEIFHPSDIINQYLFKKEDSANVAVTHDDDWITLLDEGQLKPEDFVQINSSRVEEIVANNFHVVSQDGVVFLQRKNEVVTDNNADHPHASPPIGTKGREDIPDDSFNTPVDVDAPPPAYGTESPERLESTDVTEKSYLLPEVIDVPALTQPPDIHPLLLPYDPRTSKHLLRFDVIFPVDQICYQYSNNARERLADEDLDEPAFSEPITKMRITFEQRPFNWTVDVDNSHRIRCRDVFEAIYNNFNQQLTLGELWRLPDRRACEDAFRIRTLVLKSSRMERSLGWKRVDALLHHTMFHGLTPNPDSEGEWVLNLGVPLPVARHGLPLSPTLFFSRRRDSSSTEEDSVESSDEDLNSSMSPILALRGLYTAEAVSVGRLALHSSPSVTTPAVPPQQQFVRSRPVHRPLGPRSQVPPKSTAQASSLDYHAVMTRTYPRQD